MQTLSNIAYKSKKELESDELKDEQTEEICEKIYRSMLPKFQKEIIEDKSWELCFMTSGRGFGKTYNTTLAVLYLALKEGKDAVICRKVGKSLEDSLIKEFSAMLERLQISHLFKETAEDIIYKPKKIKFSFKGMRDPESFKSLSGFKIAWIEESQQFVQKDWEVILPTLRSGDNSHRFLITGNVPKEGKKSYNYYRFLEKPEPLWKSLSLTYQDNIHLFPTDEQRRAWIEKHKKNFRGREKKFRREILGEFTEDNSNKIVTYFEEKEECPLYEGRPFIALNATAGEIYGVAGYYEKRANSIIKIHCEEELLTPYDKNSLLNWIDSTKIAKDYKEEVVIYGEVEAILWEIRQQNLATRQRKSLPISDLWESFLKREITYHPSLEILEGVVNECVFDIPEEGYLKNDINLDKGDPFCLLALSLIS